MAKLLKKNLGNPDDRRPFQDHGEMEIYKLGDESVGRGTFEPGWRWSSDIKPIVGTDSCEVLHSGYIVSGRMHVRMNDGQEEDLGPGDLAFIPPGHDAWVVGDEACVIIDFGAIAHYAERMLPPYRQEEAPATH